MQRRTGADLVLDALDREGVDLVFGYPGGAIMPLHDALYAHRVRHVLVRHEAAAAFAASGYARSSGRVGVCVATSGPGATNLITGIADALMDNVPLVALTGQVKSTLMGTDAFQEIDVTGVTHVVTKRNVVVRSVSEIEEAIHTAFAIARGNRPGPVLVDLPSDILKALAVDARPADNTAANTTRAVMPATRCSPLIAASNESITAVVNALQRAAKPLVIVGGGARWSGATTAYRDFCARYRAPHAATLHGLGCADPADPRFLGMLGMHGWTCANRAVAQADLILALGMRFDDRVTGDPKTFAPNAKTIIHADIDAAEFNKVIPAHVTLHGDLAETLRLLNNALATVAAEEQLPSFESWNAEAASLGGPLPRDSEDGHLSATDVLDAFFAAAPKDAIVTTDVGQHQMWAAQRARPCDPHAFLTSGGLGSMGFGFPAAIGAQFAHPKRPVVAIVGDGGFQMSMAELATLKRYRLPVKMLLIDNRFLGMVRQWQQLFYESRYAATSLWDNPNFCAIAAAYDIPAQSVGPQNDLHAAIDRFINEPGPALLHAACYPNENVFPMIPSGTSVDHLIEALPA